MTQKKEMIYRCSHCNKPYYSKSGCMAHEAYCIKDPKNKTCATCDFSDYGICRNEDEELIRTSWGKGDFFTMCSGWQPIKCECEVEDDS